MKNHLSHRFPISVFGLLFLLVAAGQSTIV
jgi:hypothetical protein